MSKNTVAKKVAIEASKARVARSRRRAGAVKEHSKTALRTGLDAVRRLGSVARRQLARSASAQRDLLVDPGQPVMARLRLVVPTAIESLAEARTEVTAALSDGYHAVSERLAHVTDVTHKERAIEKRMQRRTKKIIKATVAHADERGEPAI